MRIEIKHNGKAFFAITTTRRYGKEFYTWIDYFEDEDKIRYGYVDKAIGDPFPVARPKNNELVSILEWILINGEKWKPSKYGVVYC